MTFVIIRYTSSDVSIEIESSRVTDKRVSYIDPKVRLQMATSVCVSNFTLIKMSIKIESSRNFTNVSAIEIPKSDFK